MTLEIRCLACSERFNKGKVLPYRVRFGTYSAILYCKYYEVLAVADKLRADFPDILSGLKSE